MFGVYACGFCNLNVILWESRSHNPPLSAWGVWKGVIHFLSPPCSGGLRMNPRPLVIPRPGVRMFSSEKESEQTGLAFLSLPHQSMCARIHRLNSRRIICFLALHTMAILQAYQTDVLKEIRGDWSDSGGCKGAAQSQWLSSQSH